MTTQGMKRRFNAGYTIDQTILVVAIIGLLVTMVVLTVGLDIINRTGGAKLASQLRQIENANSQFYSTHSMWVSRAVTPTGAAGTDARAGEYMFGLTGSAPTYVGEVDAADLRNYVSGFRANNTAADDTSRLLHDFGGGDAADEILLHERVVAASTGLGAGRTYLIVEMKNVPGPEALEADEKIDGDGSNTATRAEIGRVFFVAAGTGCAAGGDNTDFNADVVDLCFASNLVQ